MLNIQVHIGNANTIFMERDSKKVYIVYMTDSFLKKFGKRIQLYRQACGYSQERLAELSELSSNSISSLETGKSFIKYPNLKSLCKALKTTPEKFFRFDSPGYTIKDENLKEIINIVEDLPLETQQLAIKVLKALKED